MRHFSTFLRALGPALPVVACGVTLIAANLRAQPPATGEEPGSKVARIELRLERLDNATWKEVDPATVFHPGDRLRFQFRANFNGYLYVMNQGTSGAYELLFPRQDTGSMNRVQADRSYIVPATEGGAFRVSGPPGYDVMHWMVTPLDLEKGEANHGYVPLPPPPKSGALPKSMTPRCDDGIWKARGECIDSDAGAHAVDQAGDLPDNLQGIPHANSRDLLFIQKDKAAIVSSPDGLVAPVIYEFRLAHK